MAVRQYRRLRNTVAGVDAAVAGFDAGALREVCGGVLRDLRHGVR